jgi:hypothetical protein
MQVHGGMEVWLQALTLALHENKWSTSRPGRFTPRKEHRHQLDRRLGGPQTDLDVVAKRKIPYFLKSNPDRPAHSLITILIELSRLRIAVSTKCIIIAPYLFKVQ